MPGPLCICALSLGRCPRQGSCWPCVRLHSVACILYPALSCTRALFCLRATCTPPTPFCKSHVHPCPFWREPRAPYPHLSAKAMCTHALFGESHVHPTHTFLQKPCTPMPFRKSQAYPRPSHTAPCPPARTPCGARPHARAPLRPPLSPRCRGQALVPQFAPVIHPCGQKSRSPLMHPHGLWYMVPSCTVAHSPLMTPPCQGQALMPECLGSPPLQARPSAATCRRAPSGRSTALPCPSSSRGLQHMRLMPAPERRTSALSRCRAGPAA